MMWRRFNNTFLRPVVRQLENVYRFMQGKKKSASEPAALARGTSALAMATPQERQIQQLSELVSQLCEEIVMLRDEKTDIIVKRTA